MFKSLFVVALLMGQSAPPTDPAVLYQQGLTALRASNWTQAATMLARSQQRAPSAMSSYLLAVAYSHQLQYDKTEQAARVSLEFAPPLVDQFRGPAARLVGWAQAMKADSHISVQYAMSNPWAPAAKDPAKVAARPLPEDPIINDERSSTAQLRATPIPCAKLTGLPLNQCRIAHAKDPILIPATRLP